jgi:uncharacterized RDD family membrane protein YckC
MDALQMSYAGFWKRFAAYLIDSIIIGTASMILLIPLLAAVGLGVFSLQDSDLTVDSDTAISFLIAILAGYLLLILGIAVAGWLYYALMESSGQQGTLGKMALGIKVTDMMGNRITFGRATGRYFAKFISSFTLGIGYIVAGFTQQKQALHDIVAGCLVVNK